MCVIADHLCPHVPELQPYVMDKSDNTCKFSSDQSDTKTQDEHVCGVHNQNVLSSKGGHFHAQKKMFFFGCPQKGGSPSFSANLAQPLVKMANCQHECHQAPKQANGVAGGVQDFSLGEMKLTNCHAKCIYLNSQYIGPNLTIVVRME